MWSVLSLAFLAAGSLTAEPRPMKFMDILSLNTVSARLTISPDGARGLYTVSAPDWKDAKSYSDIYLVSLREGLPSSRRLTFTANKNESSPEWSRDGKFFAFLSNREAPAASGALNQIYIMRPDGGEARRATEAKDGVNAFAFTKDGQWVVYQTGKPQEAQLWMLPATGLDAEVKPRQLTKHATAMGAWQIAPDSARVYFLAADAIDKPNRDRLEKKFTARIRNQEAPLVHLWAIDLAEKKEARVTSSADYAVSDIVISKDGKWIGFTGTPRERYQRTVMEANIYADLYLLNTASGDIERLTRNQDIGEGGFQFSPDSRMMAFHASEDFQYFRRDRTYVRPVAQKGEAWKKLGNDFEYDMSTGFWSEDGKTIYFGAAMGATMQTASVSTDTGAVKPLTKLKGFGTVSRDDDTGTLTVRYEDPSTPADHYTVDSLASLADRSTWRRLTDANPRIRALALGEVQTIQWKSTDGRMVEGVLTKPLGYEAGKRYPLIVMIHGGPAGTDFLNFGQSAVYPAQVYSAAGYAVLRPNYRGSAGYGEKFRSEIAGKYFAQAFDDIMSGVDHLIGSGMVDGDKMGAMGWSAGGHWSNWILTHTDRFKAISSGAGAVNWISMYAQTDVQRIREFYFKGKPYDNFEHWWNESPLKYIRDAKTPTLIHVVDGDPRVPRAQSEELHMALKKLGVATELIVYPGDTHGITEPRNQLVKMVSEFRWFDKYIHGKPGWFEWKELLDTLEDPKPAVKEAPASGARQ